MQPLAPKAVADETWTYQREIISEGETWTYQRGRPGRIRGGDLDVSEGETWKYQRVGVKHE